MVAVVSFGMLGRTALHRSTVITASTPLQHRPPAQQVDSGVVPSSELGKIEFYKLRRFSVHTDVCHAYRHMTCRIAGPTFVLKPTNKKVRKFYRWIMFLPYKLVCGVDPALCRNRCLCDEQVAILHLFRHQERSQLGCFCSCGCVLNPAPGAWQAAKGCNFV